MIEYYQTDKDIIVNSADNPSFIISAGEYVLTEADGTLSACSEAELESNISRIDADIVVRDEAIAQAHEAVQEAVVEETPVES